MTAVLLGAIRTLINFHSCLGICLVVIPQSGLTCLLGLCSHFKQKRGFLHRAICDLCLSHQSTKTTKANIPSWGGPRSPLTLYLSSNSIWELSYRVGVKIGCVQGDNSLVRLSAPSKLLYKTAEQLYRYHYLMQKEARKKWHLSQCAFSPSDECFSLGRGRIH